MAVAHICPTCPFCGKGIAERIVGNSPNDFFGDNTIGWDYISHDCDREIIDALKSRYGNMTQSTEEYEVLAMPRSRTYFKNDSGIMMTLNRQYRTTPVDPIYIDEEIWDTLKEEFKLPEELAHDALRRWLFMSYSLINIEPRYAFHNEPK